MTKTFHLDNNNIPGEFYATTTLRILPILILLKIHPKNFLEKGVVNRALFCCVRCSRYFLEQVDQKPLLPFSYPDKLIYVCYCST